jgi:hypothetical protein
MTVADKKDDSVINTMLTQKNAPATHKYAHRAMKLVLVPIATSLRIAAEANVNQVWIVLRSPLRLKSFQRFVKSRSPITTY